jgi:hypothetical protein
MSATFSTLGRNSAFALWAALLLSRLTYPLLAQTTVSTGNIEGAVSDPSGAIVPGAKVTITNLGTGQLINLTSNSSGAFNSGALVPGSYRTQVSAKGFSAVEVPVTVLVGNTATVNINLQIGGENVVMEVQTSAAQVNLEQSTVQGVLDEQQIERLPVNGRNFLDLAQLEPGVQIQDAASLGFGFKEGYSSISVGGRFGRTERIEVDGIDVSDERFGSSTTNVPASAIQEFQISQSSLDLSTELTTSGAVNVTTRSGTNNIHGEAFGFFRDSSLAAALPAPPGLREPFQRSQYGGRMGGPIIRNKFFYFLDGERTLQHVQAPVLEAPPFEQYSGNFSAPFHENNLLAKADYQLTPSVHAFYRFNYFQNSFTANGGVGFSLYSGKNITRTHVAGLEFNTGSFSHSIRFGYLKTERDLADGSKGSGLLLANYPLNIQIGPTLLTGPTFNAPGLWRQSNLQGKYDGTKTLGSHIIRYGLDFNRIASGGFVPFGALAPGLFTSIRPMDRVFAQNGSFPGGDTNPLNYPVEFVFLTNGLGYTTPKPGLGLPAGNFLYHRLGAYIGDSSKLKRNLTLSIGLRYERESGRSDSEFPPIPQLNALIPGLGNRVRQPNLNFAPQLGFAWDPTGKGKTVIRGGIGLFYENVLTSVSPRDPSFRASKGDIFVQHPTACNGSGSPQSVSTPQGVLQPTFCGTPGNQVAIGDVGDQIAAFQKLYQADSPFNLNAPNSNYVGSRLDQGLGIDCCMFDPDYRTPRSVEMNIGVQREIRSGLVFSADFVRNVQTHYFLGVDENDTGDVRYFNKSAAQKAIAGTLAACGVTTVDQAIQACPGLYPGGQGATMADFSDLGLTSSADFNQRCGAIFGYPCAFPGINPNAPALPFYKPMGRSVYNGLQTRLTQNVEHPFRAVRTLDFQVSYALSRFENSGGAVPSAPISSDQDSGPGAIDNVQPNRFFGPASLDRTHQLSFGGNAELPAGFQLGVIAHFWSPLSTSLVVPFTNLGRGEIFRTDFTGDGTAPDLIPGTHVGNFDRGIDASNINQVLSNYNSTIALNLTPAGQVLVKNGLFTAAQLGVGDSLCYDNPNNLPVNSLCGIAPPVPLAPPGEVNLAWMRAFDLTVSWTRRIRENLTVQPSAGFYNLFNFSNFDLPGNALDGVLTGSVGQINGTTRSSHNINRVGVGTGVYSLGAPRQIEFGLRLTF